MADEHTFALTIEASGDVTPAPNGEPTETHTDEATPQTDDEEMADG